MGHDGDGNAIERLRRQRSTLASFGLRAFNARDTDDLLQEATSLVSDALEVRFAKILEWHPDDEELLVRAGVNWKPGVVGNAKLRAGPHSAAGYALRSREPVISRDVTNETRFEIPDLMIEHGIKSMVNVIISGQDQPYGVLEIDAPEHRDFDQDDIDFLQTYANLLAAAIDRISAHTAIQKAAADRKLLNRELLHRAQNLLSVVQSMILQTSVENRGAVEFRDALRGRIAALGQAQKLAFESRTDGVNLDSLIKGVLKPYGDAPFKIDGEAACIDSRKAQMIGLAIHELATNASKYGALSVPEGEVEVSWTVERDDGGWVRLSWRERNGPAVAPPARSGFGSRLIERACVHELGGEAALDFLPEGLVCRISFPWRPDG